MGVAINVFFNSCFSWFFVRIFLYYGEVYFWTTSAAIQRNKPQDFKAMKRLFITTSRNGTTPFYISDFRIINGDRTKSYTYENIHELDEVFRDNNICLGLNCSIGDNVQISEDVNIGHGVTISDRCVINKDVCICDNATIGKSCFIWEHSTIKEGAKIGCLCNIGPCSCVNNNEIIPDFDIF